MVAVRVRDEYLPEAVAADELNYLLHSVCVELVEDVIKQEERCGAAACPAQEVELGEFQRDEERLALALRAFPADGVSALQHFEVVLVNAMQGVAHGSVLEASRSELFQQWTALKMRDIAQFHLLAVLRDVVVELLEDGNKFGDELAALLEDVLPFACHLLLKDEKDLRVEFLFLLQHGVPLLQSPVVAHEGLRVGRVILTDYHIDKAASLLAAARDEHLVGRRDHDERNESDVLGDALVGLLAAAYARLSSPGGCLPLSRPRSRRVPATT